MEDSCWSVSVSTNGTLKFHGNALGEGKSEAILLADGHEFSRCLIVNNKFQFHINGAAASIKPGCVFSIAIDGVCISNSDGSIECSIDDHLMHTNNSLDLGQLASEGYYLNKKGKVVPHNILESRQDFYLNIYSRVSALLYKEFGLVVFASHGTLLGLYRDGALIPHDDDFDTCYISSHSNAANIKLERLAVMKYLKASGLSPSFSPSGSIRVRDDNFNLHIDLMPAWFSDGFFNISSFTSMEADKSDIFPPSYLLLDDTKIPAFANTEKFLTHQYGQWKVPEPGFRYELPARCLSNRKLLSPSEEEVLLFARKNYLKICYEKLSGTKVSTSMSKKKLRSLYQSLITR
jgi:hypothetical protein